MLKKKKIVIIGSGLAGYHTAKEWRKLDPYSELVIITEDNGSFYSKPMLSNAFAKQKTADQLIIQKASDIALQLKATLFTHCHVTHIKTEEQLIVTHDGAIISYDELVLAIGAHQKKLPFKSLTSALSSINNLEDYRKLRQKIENKKSIGIIGAGLIGCELANDFSSHFRVTLFDQSDRPLSQLLPPDISTALQAALETTSVQFALSSYIHDIEFENEIYTVILKDNRRLSFDCLLCATGLIPNIELANTIGLKTNKGIFVNETLETSQKNIYALGDCIEWHGLLLPYILPLMAQAKALAKTLSGNPTPFSLSPAPIVIKTPCLPIIVFPPHNKAGQWKIKKKEGNNISAVFENDEQKIHGFACSGTFINDKNIYMPLIMTN